MTGPRDLLNMTDDAAFMSLEHQVHVDEDVLEQLGPYRVAVDLDGPSFSFIGERGRIDCTAVHLLGSAAPGPGSWLWSWANPGQYGPGVKGLAEALRDYGQQNGIPELTSPEVPFAQWPTSSSEPVRVAGFAADAAKAFSGRWVHYTPEVGGGTRLALLLEHESFALPAPTPARLMRILQQGLQEVPIADHRRALNTYAYRRGLSATFSPDGTSLALGAPGFTATLSFNENGRVSSIDASMGGPPSA